MRRNGVGVCSSHSNPRILKTNRRNRRTSAYDEDDYEEAEAEDEDDGGESEDDESELSDVRLSISKEFFKCLICCAFGLFMRLVLESAQLIKFGVVVVLTL